MIKKILISIGVLFSFFLMFLFGFDKINVLAYSDIGNALGSYPVKLDIDNYNVNLLNFETISNTRNYHNTFTFDNENYSITQVSTGNYSYSVYTFENATIVGETYNISFKGKSSNIVDPRRVGFGTDRNSPDSFNYGRFIMSLEDALYNLTFTATSTDLCVSIYISTSYDSTGVVIDINNLMLVKGESPKEFGQYFKFGYNVNYSLAVNNLTSNQVNAGIAITDSNGNYLKTGNCVVPASSSTICSNINDPLYLPFNIDNNGYISFDYSLGLFIGPVGFLSVTPNDSGLNFVPVFDAYYNSSPTNNLYFKDRYTFNNLFLSGFNVSVNSSTLSKVTFPRNQVDSEFSMNTNKIVNFATDKKIETGIYNYINYVDFINSSPSDIYSFVITTGVSSPVLFDNRIYTISFSNLSLKVNGDTGNVSPLPNNPNTINKYNECSAWYDIPCQLGNGLTYVIYEAPIISPVLTFIVSFITMFSSLVSFVDLFRSFGIVFGCFVIYMFINLLHKYSK